MKDQLIPLLAGLCEGTVAGPSGPLSCWGGEEGGKAAQMPWGKHVKDWLGPLENSQAITQND